MAVHAEQSPVMRAFVLCGLCSSILYLAIDIGGALRFPGYDYAAQAISEMSAIGAPTADLLAPFYRAWSLLFLAFILSLWRLGRSRPPLRRSAAFLVGVAVVGTGFALFPMNQRSATPTFSDTMHLLIAGATILLLAGAMLTAARAFGRGFRIYSSASAAVMLIFFVLTMRDVPNVAADLPTPNMGLNERVSMAAWLFWIAVLSLRLWRSGGSPVPATSP
jgi:hypothetical protein